MPFAKVTSKFDYVMKSRSMVSYPAGFEGDMPQAHYDRALALGKLDEKASGGTTTPSDEAQALVKANNETQLRQIAADENVDLKDASTKTAIAEAIVAKRTAK